MWYLEPGSEDGLPLLLGCLQLCRELEDGAVDLGRYRVWKRNWFLAGETTSPIRNVNSTTGYWFV